MTRNRDRGFVRITCVDGFNFSAQVSDCHYCTPRKNGAEAYTEVEVGFPSEEDKLLLPYAEPSWDSETDELYVNATRTVYPYTPASVVVAVIKKHGGIVSGELPPLKNVVLMPKTRRGFFAWLLGRN